jgi:hypothetical protein
MDGKQLQTQYKEHLSDFNNWNQKEHAEDFILYPKNIGYHLCIDETALANIDKSSKVCLPGMTGRLHSSFVVFYFVFVL